MYFDFGPFGPTLRTQKVEFLEAGCSMFHVPIPEGMNFTFLILVGAFFPTHFDKKI